MRITWAVYYMEGALLDLWHQMTWVWEPGICHDSRQVSHQLQLEKHKPSRELELFHPAACIKGVVGHLG